MKKKIKFTRMMLQLLRRKFFPLEVCLKAYKLQMYTIYNLACMDSSYETMQDRGVGNKMKIYYNYLANIENIVCTFRSVLKST